MKSPVVSMKSIATADLVPESEITCSGKEADPGIEVTEVFTISGESKNAIGKL